MLMLPMVVSLAAALYFGATRTYEVMETDWIERKAVLERHEQIKADEQWSARLIAEVEADRLKQENPPAEGDAEADKEDEIDVDSLEGEAKINHQAERRFKSFHRREVKSDKERTAFTQDSWWTLQPGTGPSMPWMSCRVRRFLRPSSALPLFMVGYWFVASGAIRRPQEHKALFKGLAWIGFGLGLFMTVGGFIASQHPTAIQAREVDGATNTFFFAGQYFMTAGYIGLFVLAAMTARGQRWLSWLVPMGRMALTNYITHSIILTSIFYGYAGGMFGEISRAPQMAIVFAIIAVQAVFSAWWLKHYRFGPLEWLWRSLTYWQVQPLRKPAEAESTRG